MNIRQPVASALMLEGKSLVVYAEEVEQGGVEVVDVDFVFHRVVTEVVGCAVVVSGFHASASEPGRESVRIVIAAVLMATGNAVEKFEGRGSAKLAPADDEGVV